MMAGPKSARPSAPGPHRRGTLALITVLGLMVCGGVAAQQLHALFSQALPPLFAAIALTISYCCLVQTGTE